MKKVKIVSYKRTNSAAIAVQKELSDIGLWYEDCELLNAEIYWCPVPQITSVGMFFHGTSILQRVLGYKIGHIYIPAIVMYNVFKQQTESVREIIRHEYAHAFAHYYQELIVDSKEFNSVFGGNYFSYESSEMEDEAYVSEYAKTIPGEDFAETFRVYVRRLGVMPPAISNTKLKRKWNFINKTIKKINEQL